MAMGECVAYSNLQVDSKGQVCSLAYELAATRLLPTFTQRTRVNSCIWLSAVDVSISNIVVVLLSLLFFITVSKVTYAKVHNTVIFTLRLSQSHLNVFDYAVGIW